MLSQSKIAHELHLSRSVIHDNVRAGMPLDSIEAARAWRRGHVGEKFNYKAHRAKQELARRLPEPAPEPEPMVNGKFTREATQDIIARLREFLADGAGEEGHPDHQTFCDGVRIALDYGTS